MRNKIWISMLSVALLGGAACHKKDDAGKAMDKAGTAAAKAQEDIHDQAKDVRDEQKDVNKDADKMAKDQADVAKQQGELSAAQGELAQARERYNVAAKQRLTNLDAKISQLEMKTDAKLKADAAAFRARRDELASKLGSIGTQAQADWDHFRKDVDDAFDKLEKDVDGALK
jgi:chromosome segregation ATPase